MAKFNYGGNVVDRPGWIAGMLDEDALVNYPAKLNIAGFTNQFGIVVQLTANAAAAATSIAVVAMAPLLNSPVPLISLGRILIPAGTVLDFGGAKFARLSADAKQGDTTLSVDALPTALVSGDVAYWNWNGRLYVQSGIPLGRTLAERDAGTGFGILDPAGDQEYGILMFNLTDARNDNDIELLAPNEFFPIYENWLPNYATSLRPGGTDSATMTFLRAHYQCIVGVK